MAAGDVVRRTLRPLRGAANDYDGLLAEIAGARVVLLGEASHGTHEFYRERALVTRRLITEHGFTGVAVEADWPAAWRVNRYVTGRGQDASAAEALDDFRRFPAWMWRNADVLDFVEWLRADNERRAEGERVGFYGLDLYSLHASIEAVLRYLDTVDPEAARRARERYACFDHFGDDPQAYGYATSAGLSPSCEAEVVSQLVELRRRAGELAGRDGRLDPDAFFHAERSAALVHAAERYYRVMFQGRVESWNLRDRHMTETLVALAGHLGGAAKLVVWAHNSHLGDARATGMGAIGEITVGQLVRERWGPAAFLVGFTTHHGTVTAASEWGGEAERMHVRPALAESWEAVFHAAGVPRFLLAWRRDHELAAALSEERLERAIGVVYVPRTERVSHYVGARLARQFDAVIHIDASRAVEPLERAAGWERGELPETYPTTV
jgi:erythromycin esterase-like protein